jgi:hypothetical protein
MACRSPHGLKLSRLHAVEDIGPVAGDSGCQVVGGVSLLFQDYIVILIRALSVPAVISERKRDFSSLLSSPRSSLLDDRVDADGRFDNRLLTLPNLQAEIHHEPLSQV